MSRYIGGPLDGEIAFSHLPSRGATYTAYMQIESGGRGTGIKPRRAPYRYRASEDGKDWVFDSWGEPVIEDRPVIVDIQWGQDEPSWTTVMMNG